MISNKKINRTFNNVNSVYKNFKSFIVLDSSYNNKLVYKTFFNTSRIDVFHKMTNKKELVKNIIL